MKQILDFYKSNRYAILWTIAYIATVWGVMLFLFGFDIFILHNWILLKNAELRGFAGFAFGIMTLAALPLYVATTAVIMRTKKPLITININKIVAPVIRIVNACPPLTERPAPQKIDVPTPDPAPSLTPEKPHEFPSNMPTEVRQAFIRARHNMATYAVSQYNRQTPITPTAPESTPAPEISDLGDIPLPSDFDVDFDDIVPNMPDIDTPVFTDINFGDDDTDDTDDAQPEPDNIIAELDKALTPPTNPDTEELPSAFMPILTELDNRGISAEMDGDLIVGRKTIIAVHDDPDFWIADPENWFAAGRQKPSPIVELIRASARHKLKPVLYLNQTNIMDIDNCRAEWEKMGITVITDATALPE